MASRNLDDLDSRFRPIAESVIADCLSAGVPVTIITTLRSSAEQAHAVATGVSWTLHSLHLPQPPDGKSLALDLAVTEYLAMKNWNPVGEKWWVIARSAVARGLRSGMDWHSVGLPPTGTTRPSWDPSHMEMRVDRIHAPLVTRLA